MALKPSRSWSAVRPLGRPGRSGGRPLGCPTGPRPGSARPYAAGPPQARPTARERASGDPRPGRCRWAGDRWGIWGLPDPCRPRVTCPIDHDHSRVGRHRLPQTSLTWETAGARLGTCNGYGYLRARRYSLEPQQSRWSPRSSPRSAGSSTAHRSRSLHGAAHEDLRKVGLDSPTDKLIPTVRGAGCRVGQRPRPTGILGHLRRK